METLKVLVVDDEPGIRSGIERTLRNYSVGFPFIDEGSGFLKLVKKRYQTSKSAFTSEPGATGRLDEKNIFSPPGA